jgi:hypothetical protein
MASYVSLPGVEIDGVYYPGQQMLDTVRAAVQSTEEPIAVLQNALAQPIGEALAQTKGLCDQVRSRLKRVIARMGKAAGDQANIVADTLANAIGSAVQMTGQAVDQTAMALPTAMRASSPGSTPTATTSSRAATQPAPTLALYLDCGFICAGLFQVGMTLAGDAPNGGDAAGAWLPYQGDTIPCPAGLDCYSKTWRRFTGTLPDPFPPSYGIGAVWTPITRANLDAMRQWCGCPTGGAGGVAPPITGQYCLYWQCVEVGPPPVNRIITDLCGTNPGDSYPIPGSGTYPTAIDAMQAAPQFQEWVDAQPCPVPTPAPPAIPGPAPPSTATGGESACIVLQPCVSPSATPCSLTDTALSIPKIGSAEFILASDAMRQWFIDLGNKVLSWIKGRGDDFAPPDSVSKTTDPSAPEWVNTIIPALQVSLLAWGQGGAVNAAKQLSSTVDCWKGVVDNVNGCNLPAVVSMSVAKAVIEVLQRFRIGWDLIVWGTFDLTIHIDALVKVLDYLIAAACPAELPHYGDVVDAWLTGGMDDNTATALLRFQGIDVDVWNTVIQSRREKITPEQVVNLGRRASLSDDTIAETLRGWGFINPQDAADFIEAYDELPTISDVLHFLQRNVFDTQYVADYGLMEGFEERFWPRYGTALRAQGVLETTARDHYAAHWINPSIGQLAEMAQRQRPGRVDPAVQFQWSDFLRVLAEQDVAPYFRDRLRAISFRLFPIRQLTQLALTRQIDEPEMAERAQDYGFSPEDAAMFAHTLMINANRQRATQQKGITPAVAAKLIPIGLLSRDDAVSELADQGMTAEDVDTLIWVATKELQAQQYEQHTKKTIADYATLATKAYGDGVVDRQTAELALQKAGYLPEAIALELDTVALRVRMAKIDAARQAIHKSFLRGEVSASEAQSALVLVGVQPDSAADFVERWQLELTTPRKSAATGQILKWAREGIISVANAEARLNNLHWSPPDIVLMLAEVNQEIKQAQALAAKRTAADLARAEAAAARAAAGVVKSYCKFYPYGRLKLQFSERVIDEGTVRDRLTHCGYTADAIDHAIDEFTVARDKKDAQAAKKGAFGIEYTGPGAVTGGPSA